MGLTHEGESKSGRFWPVPKDGVSSIGQLRNGIPDNYGWLVPGRNLPLDPHHNPPPHSTSVFTGVLLLVFSCAVQEGVLVMGQVVGVFIRFSSYW